MSRWLGLLCLVCAGAVQAEGDLLKQVRESSRAAEQANQAREERFRQARAAMEQRLRETVAEVRRSETRVTRAKARWEDARREAAVLERQVQAASRSLEALYDAARGAAVDLHDAAQRSPVTAQFPDRMDALAPLAASATLPGAPELEALWRALQDDLRLSAEVVRFEAEVVGVEATEVRPVIRAGVFSVFGDGRYYLLDAGGTRLAEMARPPSRHYLRLARAFEARRGGLAPIVLDPSRGPLLVADANRPGLFERLWQSGVGGYFFAGILILAAVLALAQVAWLRWRVLLDEQSIGVTAAVLLAFAVVQWWLWVPREPGAADGFVAMVNLVSEVDSPDEPPPPDLTPPPPPPDVPMTSENALAGLPALAAPTAAPLLSNINVPVKIAGGGSLSGLGFGGFARGTGQGAGAFGRGAGFKGRELIPLSTARPQMPEWACRQNIKGWVEAVFTVLPNGRVQDVKIVDASPRGVYEIAAIESISNWIYEETGSAREVKQRVPMDPADCAYNWQ